MGANVARQSDASPTHSQIKRGKGRGAPGGRLALEWATLKVPGTFDVCGLVSSHYAY